MYIDRNREMVSQDCHVYFSQSSISLVRIKTHRFISFAISKAGLLDPDQEEQKNPAVVDLCASHDGSMIAVAVQR